ncbi:MAG: HflK protein, partial [Paracoccaceae bacterium]|nr:HflK protein [Paracoccaceae bacterium]
MTGNNGGPWGGGNRGNNGGGQRPPDDSPQIPEIDELVKKGQEQLRVLLGGRGGGTGGGDGGQSGPSGPAFTTGTLVIAAVIAVGLWAMASFYTVKPEEQSVELMLGKYSSTGNPGLNFAPWPLISAEVLPVRREQSEDIGVGGSGSDAGLMLTGDENIVD